MQLMQEATSKCGGSYCYVNIKGGVGERTYFDGGNIFCENGKIYALEELETLEDVLVTTAICNLNSTRTFRMSNKSFIKESFGVKKIPRVKV